MGVITKRIAKNGTTTFQAKCRRASFPTVSKTFTNLQDAKAFVRRVERAFDLGELPPDLLPKSAAGQRAASDSGNLATVADLLRKYREDVAPKHRGADLEQMRLDYWLRGELPFAEVAVGLLTPAHLASYRDARLKVVSAGTVLREFNLLRAVLNVAKMEWGVAVPDLKITRPKAPPPRERVLSAAEETALLAAAAKGSRNKYLAPAIIFAVETACRQGEILAVLWEDVDYERRVARLRTTKNGLPRDVPLSSRAIEVLRALPQDTRDGRVFCTYELKQAFARLVKRAKLPHIVFHDLRHTALTRYAERGLDQIRLSVISGHKTLQMLKRYVHLKAEDVAELMG
ncbi:integrase [Cupriavidus sp. TMH.W2]|uniref:integrase n=1 Tax=Cupriavidus sp. TMH.W2 TaxID=3434465 RepID=UPI003D783AF3